MSDEWRVRVDLEETGHVRPLLRELHGREVQADLAERLRHRLPVSHGERSVFAYAGDAAAAARAAALVREVLADHELSGEVAIDRWHPEEEAWEPEDVPMPATAEEVAAEHERREEREARESAAEGPQWEVRIDVASPWDGETVAEHLEARGLRPLRRWRHVFVSVATEDEARALAERLRDELPEATAVIPEGTAAQAFRATHPFAVLGGIAN